MTPETVHSPRCSIGWTGPGAPLGGGTAGSTTGGLIAAADGHTHVAAVKTAATQASPARIID
nr:hypothetical protein [Mycobacterium shimoidei]